MRSRYKFLDERAPYFVTITVVEWIPLFTTEIYCEILMESLRFCQQQKKFEVIAYVIMDNHLHLILEGSDLSKGLKEFKSFTARMILQQLQVDGKDWALNQFAFFKKKFKKESHFQVWQEGSHPQQIVDELMYQQKIDYIHENPVRRGLVKHPRDWIYSSARSFID
jgi:REP element-mobilizing transposase RayT